MLTCESSKRAREPAGQDGAWSSLAPSLLIGFLFRSNVQRAAWKLQDGCSGQAGQRLAYVPIVLSVMLCCWRQCPGVADEERQRGESRVSDKLRPSTRHGQAHMVDVSAKAETRREAVASAFVELNDAVLAALPQNPKGNPLEVARIAGIQAAKRTSELIPMCHPLALSFVDVQAEVVAGGRRNSWRPQRQWRGPGWRWRRWSPLR